MIERFHGDDLASGEVGLKWTPAAVPRLDATVTVSHAIWENIQADLVNRSGLPYTATIGSGRIWSGEATLGWRPWDALRFDATFVANDSRLTKPAPDFAGRRYELPNIAHFAGTFRAAYSRPIGGAWRLETDARFHYVGHSRLGVGRTLDLRQGDYSIAAASVRFGNPRWGLTIDADNLLDSRGNMFALGNPYNVGAGQQMVPPRPRTVRIGADAHF